MNNIKFFTVTIATLGCLALAGCNNGTFNDNGSSNAANNDNTISGHTDLTVYTTHVDSTVTIPITFTTSKDTATNLAVNLSSLGSDWSAPSGATCTQVSTDTNSCVVTLQFTPSQVKSGTGISFNYISSSGTAKSGVVNVAYNATMPDMYLTNSNVITACTPDGNGGLSCGTSTSFPVSTLYFMTIAGQKLYVGDYSNNTLYSCAIGADGSLGNCNNSNVDTNGLGGIALNNSHLYLADQGAHNVLMCTPDLSSCMPTGEFNQPSGIAFNNDYAYVADKHLNQVDYCALNADGSLANCQSTGDISLNAPTDIVFVNSGAYIDNAIGAINYCSVNTDGSLSACSDANSGLNNEELLGMSYFGGYLYIASQRSGFYACHIKADHTLEGCHLATDLPGTSSAFNL